MREEDGPGIDVDALMVRIGAGATARGGDPALGTFSSIEDLLVVAEARVSASTLTGIPLVRRIVLKLRAMATGDQRRINLALVAALRESIAANRDLAERVRALENGAR